MLLKSLITTNWIVKNLVALSELSFYAPCATIQLGLPYYGKSYDCIDMFTLVCMFLKGLIIID